MKILFIDTTHPRLLDMLMEAGFFCDYFTNLTKQEILDTIDIYDGIIIRSKITIDKEFIDKATKLKFIGRVGAGLENIDTEYAKTKGIKCFNSPEGNRDAVGEQAVGMLLCIFNNIIRANQEVGNGFWNRESNRGIEIKNKTIGIIGYGNMGNAFAQRLKGFEANVIAYDKYKTAYGNGYAKAVELEEIFHSADIVSIHVPLTDETEFMINDEFINKFRKNIFIINTARGKVLNTKDLVQNLKSGKVLGAGLDVLEYEKKSFENLHTGSLPEEFEYLIKSDNVVLTPHIAGWTHESNVKLSEFLADKIIKEFANVSSNSEI